MSNLSDPIPVPPTVPSTVPPTGPVTPANAPATPPPAFSNAEVRPLHPEETAAALRLLLGQGGYPAQDSAVADFTALAVRKHIDLSAMVVVAASGRSRLGSPRLLWAVLPIPQPGRSVLLLTPGRTDRDVLDAASAAVMLALERSMPLKHAQVLLDPHDPSAAHPLHANGFQTLARLVYLHRTLAAAPVPVGEPHLDTRPLERVTFGPSTRELFRRALSESYVGSLDCVKFNGKREVDDILEGHRATGHHDPELWTVLADEGRPAAVVLLSPTDHADALELVYLGVTPEYRRKGLAHWCMRHALQTAYERGLGRLLLAVDSENRPAMRLYYRFGMKRFHERLAMFRMFGGVPSVGVAGVRMT